MLEKEKINIKILSKKLPKILIYRLKIKNRLHFNIYENIAKTKIHRPNWGKNVDM